MRTRLFMLTAALLLTGCQDTIVKPIDMDENNVELTRDTDYIRFYADDMDNVHGTIEVDFNFSDTVAAVIHRNFVHHGQVRFNILDANGSQVYASNAEWNLDLQTNLKARPGPWKLYIGFFGARGRVDLRIQKLGTPIEE